MEEHEDQQVLKYQTISFSKAQVTTADKNKKKLNIERKTMVVQEINLKCTQITTYFLSLNAKCGTKFPPVNHNSY